MSAAAFAAPEPPKGEPRNAAEAAAQKAKAEAAPLKIGIAELGNWNDQRKIGGVAIRHLSGAMDEFALWDRALSDTEIEKMAK